MTIQTSIQKAKNWTPDSAVAMTPTDTIRARLFRGEGLNADEVANELGVSNALLGHSVATMRTLGYVLTETNADGKKRFFMQNTDHLPSAQQIETHRAKGRSERAKKKKASAKKAPAKKKAPEPEPEALPPVIGDFIEVYLLHLNGDGQVTMGLRDEQTSWMVTISAGAPRKG